MEMEKTKKRISVGVAEGHITGTRTLAVAGRVVMKDMPLGRYPHAQADSLLRLHPLPRLRLPNQTGPPCHIPYLCAPHGTGLGEDLFPIPIYHITAAPPTTAHQT